MNPPAPERKIARVVIVGGGFAGHACARALGGADIEVVVIDRRNHFLFQPLLYQVATAALSPADIAEPIRKSLGRFRNIKVLLAEVTGVDLAARTVLTDKLAPLPFDYLVIATGSEYNYFDHDEWRERAPGLKSIREAHAIRQRLLTAFEEAELASDEATQRRLLTSVVVGGGPTGVEIAGAVAELGHFMVSRDFRNIDHDRIRVILLEGGSRILSTYPQDLADYAMERLRHLGVEVVTGQMVETISEEEVVAGGKRIPAGTIVWAAGVKASPAACWLGVETGKGGQIPVTPQLEVEGMKGIYALGDTALLNDTETGKPLPGLAQVAKQQGSYLGRSLRSLIERGEKAAPFRFHNRGSTSVIGRNAAIFDFGRFHLKGRFAWFLWAVVHVFLLVNFEKRMLVALQWLWRYVTRQRGARLIDEPLPVRPQEEPAPELTETNSRAHS